MKTLLTFAYLSAIVLSTPALAEKSFTVVTENTVDVANLFTHPDLEKVDPAHSGVPAALAHAYTLRATYTIVETEAEAKIQKVLAGCDGMDGAVSCWPDHWEGRLGFNNPRNRAKWELLDAVSGKVLLTRSAQFDIGEVFNSDPSLEKINFSGEQYMDTVRFPSVPDQEYFLSKDRKISLYFSEMFLDPIYRGARLNVESLGGNRYRLVGMEYGGQTATGQVIPVIPGASFPNAGVWLTKNGDHQHPYLVGEPGNSSPWTKINVKSAE
ncbi:MAG: hypothetical protein ACXVB9_14225 [Bdellovibrionota bacterium]